MELHHVFKITISLFLVDFCTAKTCESGLILAEYLDVNFSKENCNTIGTDNCYYEIDDTTGYCFKDSNGQYGIDEEHQDLDCVYHEHLYFPGVLTDEFVQKTFPAPQQFDSFYDALKRCNELECSWLLQDSRLSLYYIVEEPLFLQMESSDHISTSNFPYMVAYLEPRCFNSDGTTVSAVEEVCAGLELPSEDVVFRIEKDSKIVFEKDGAGEACGFDCERNPSCKMWARFTEKDTCRMWGDSPGPTVTPKCVLDSIPGKAYSTVTHYQLKHKKLITEENAAVYGVDDTNKCWNICAKNPLCQELAIHESRCYIFQGSSQFDSPDPTFSEDFLSLKLKFYGNERSCDYGDLVLDALAFNNDREKCLSMGLCHANIGNVDKPSWICYTAREEPHEPVQLNDGTNQTYKIGMLQSWVPESFVISTITQRAPARMDSFEECLQHCLEISCFAVAYHRLEKSCLFELEPIAFDYRDTSTAQIPVEPNFDVAFFVRPYVEDTEEILPVAELCQDQEDLPADWQYGSALYQPFTEETAATMEECMIKCNPDGECNKRIIFRTEDGACLIFQSKEIFHQESETNSVTPINHSGQQCVIKPVLSGRIRPKSYFWELKENEQLAEPRERHFFSSDTPQLNQERNECWEYCSQIPWCQAAIEFLYQSVGTCQFYDREESIITSQDVQTRNIPEPIAVTGMIGKIFTDENFCHNGGVLGEEFSKHFFTTTEAQCDFLQLCSKTTIIGTCCYVGRETKPQPLIVKGCEMQPFLAPQDIIDVDDEILGNFLMINATSYEECVRSCSWEQHCFGLLYIPSSQECGRIIQPSTATTKGTNFVDALKRNGNSDDEVEVLMAFIIPHCPPCVQRVLMQEQISFKDEIQCTLTSQESCSDVYKTIFKTQEVEECKESFVKNCHIEYEMVPRTEKVEICHSPLTRDCNEEGPETCTTEFETVCDTTYHENEVTDDVANCNTVKEDVCDSDGENCRMVPRQVCQVDTVSSKKLTPEMDCRQEAREVCGPEICPIVQGERICVDELKTFVQEVPQEKCQISPKTVCDKVHKIVPKLEMNQECIDVPQEICQTVQVEANKEKIPIVKEWCPPAEGDSAEGDSAEEDMSGEVNSSASSSEESSSIEDDGSARLLRTPPLLEELAITKRGSRGSRAHGPSDIGQ